MLQIQHNHSILDAFHHRIQGHRQYIENLIEKYNIEITSLKHKYGISTPEEFEQLYETGKIEEKDTWRDYQQFDNLFYKVEHLTKLSTKPNKLMF